MKKFWIVLRDREGESQSVTKRHENFENARNEAKRLVVKEKDKFLILEAVSVFKPKETPVEEEKLLDEE